jgi:cytoskeletal protein RodZ
VNPVDFGDNLRRHRERRGVSLQTIADASKINRRFLAALEAGDCSRWPTGLYSRAYVRTYAAAIGLDPEEVVVEFAALFPEIAWPEGPPQREVTAENAGTGFEPSAGRVTSRPLVRGTT